MILSRRLLIVTGKGGTGRSALTAALAIRAAREGKRVLAVAMTDGQGLAAHLGQATLGYRPATVRPGIQAMAIERAAALDEYLHLQLHLPRAAPLRPVARGLDLFADAVPGIRDIITIGKVLYDAWTGSWDLIVADGPPTGQIASYLRAPATIAGLVPTGRVRDQSEWMAGLLADRSFSGLILVTLAEELPVTETAETLADLSTEELIDLAAVAVNRVLPDPGFDAGALPDLDDGAARDAALLHLGVWQSQQGWLERLPPGPRLPYLFGLHTPGEAAARLADEWIEGGPNRRRRS